MAVSGSLISWNNIAVFKILLVLLLMFFVHTYYTSGISELTLYKLKHFRH